MKKQVKYTYASWNESIPKESVCITERPIERISSDVTFKGPDRPIIDEKGCAHKNELVWADNKDRPVSGVVSWNSSMDDQDGESAKEDPRSVFLYILLLIMIFLCALALIPVIESLIKIIGLMIMLCLFGSFSNARQERKRQRSMNDDFWWE